MAGKTKTDIDDVMDRLRDGEVVEVDAEQADRLGAFEEDALSEEDALASRFDDEEDADG